MKFIIPVDRAAAINAGREQYGNQVVDVPLAQIPADLHQEISTLTEQNGATIVHYTIDGLHRSSDPTPPVFAEATVDAVIDALRHRVAVRAARSAARAADLAKAERDLERYIEQARALPVEKFLMLEYGETKASVHLPNVPGCEFPRSWSADGQRRAEQALADKLAQAAEIGAERGARAKAAKAEEAQRKAAGEAHLREWAVSHGSERLRLMLDLCAGDWLEVARREWMDAHAPDGYTHGSFGGSERRKPTLEELQELKRLRDAVARSNGVLSEETIDWVIRESEYDDKSGEEVPEERFAVAEVRIMAPDGASAWYSKRIA